MGKGKQMKVFLVLIVEANGDCDVHFVGSSLAEAKIWMLKHKDITDKALTLLVKEYEVDKDYDENSGKSH